MVRDTHAVALVILHLVTINFHSNQRIKDIPYKRNNARFIASLTHNKHLKGIIVKREVKKEVKGEVKGGVKGEVKMDNTFVDNVVDITFVHFNSLFNSQFNS